MRGVLAIRRARALADLPRRRRAADGALRVGAAVRGQRPGLQPPRPLAGRRDHRRRPPLQARLARAVALVRRRVRCSSGSATSTPTATRGCFGADVPFPSLGDGAYVAVYPALMAGLLMLVRRRNPERDRAGVIDSLIMTLGLALLSWVALIAPYLHDETMTVTRQARLGRLPARRHPAARRGHPPRGRHAASACRPSTCWPRRIVALLVTDFAYGVVTLHGAYDGQVILDVGWISFYLLWGAAALHPSMRQLEQPAPDRVPRLTPLRLALLTVASLIAPVVEATQELRRGNLDLLVIIAASVVLFGLVVAAHGRPRAPAGALRRPRAHAERGRRVAGRRHRPRRDLPRRPDGRARRSSTTPPLRACAWSRRAGSASSRPRGPRARRRQRGRSAPRPPPSCWPRPPPGSLLVSDDARRPSPRARARPRPRPRPQPPRRRARPARRQRRVGDLARAAQRPAGRAARAGHADLAGPRERGADRGGPPPRERGALRLARPARQRPHHGARRRRHRRLPEPVDRARPRLRARRT